LNGGHGDDLAEVRRVGDDLLITGHGGVENAFAGDGGGGAKRTAAKHAAIFKG
jgi:hypothetical protein